MKTHTGFDPESQPLSGLTEEEAKAEMNCVELVGSSAIQLRDQFRKNMSWIAEGTFPSLECQGILISSEFAKLNSLRVNDSVDLKKLYADPDPGVTNVKVVGIYDTSLKFEILEDNNMGGSVYKASPYNAVFADYDTASRILGWNEPVNSMKVYVDSPQYLNEVQQEISQLALDWTHYQIYNNTIFYYNEYASQINAVSTNSLRLIVMTSTFGLILFLFVFSIWNKSRFRDIGILEALGETKKILAQYFLETLFLSVVAVLVAIPGTFALLKFLSRTNSLEFVSSNSVNMEVPFYTGEFEVSPKFLVTMDGFSVALLITFALLISVLAMAMVCRNIKKSSLRTLCDEGE